MKITDWDLQDRPREKMMANGADVLTDAELLAILINSGQKGRSAMDIAREVLKDCNYSLLEFSNILFDKEYEGKKKLLHGLGPAKICTIQAALELGRRKEREAEINRLNAITISCSQQIFAQFNQQLNDLPYEELWALYLSRSGKVLKRYMVGSGGVDYSPGDIRRIVRPALESMCSHVCLCHNHPHSMARPSKADESLTQAVAEALKLFDIRLLDHVIIADGRYFSFRDNGMI